MTAVPPWTASQSCRCLHLLYSGTPISGSQSISRSAGWDHKARQSQGPVPGKPWFLQGPQKCCDPQVCKQPPRVSSSELPFLPRSSKRKHRQDGHREGQPRLPHHYPLGQSTRNGILLEDFWSTWGYRLEQRPSRQRVSGMGRVRSELALKMGFFTEGSLGHLLGLHMLQGPRPQRLPVLGAISQVPNSCR